MNDARMHPSGQSRKLAFRKSIASLALAVGVSFFAVKPALANTRIAALCERAADDAASRTGIPAQIMQVLSLTETGQNIDGSLRPWPWALNHAGTGHWFASQTEMVTFAQDLLAAGDTNFDLGCFQLNYRWHQQSFASLQDMADPVQNANYAAGFLREKHQATGSWETAIGAYHSQTEELASKYLARFVSILAGLGTKPQSHEPARDRAHAPVQRQTNSFPLLISGQSSRGPSLFPEVTTRRRLIGGNE